MMTPTQHAATRKAQSGWWPWRYGADDRAGALNEITPRKVLDAPGSADAPFAVPQLLNVRHGVVVAENLRLGEAARDRLHKFQCREDVLPGYSYLGGRLGISAVAHQNGTVRFGADPATSALDLNCKMHELDNLYVVDSSFFVSSTAVNPTLTIIANALRVADHIAGRLGATSQHETRPGATPVPTGVAGHA